jgi:hypothetical protein
MTFPINNHTPSPGVNPTPEKKDDAPRNESETGKIRRPSREFLDGLNGRRGSFRQERTAPKPESVQEKVRKTVDSKLAKPRINLQEYSEYKKIRSDKNRRLSKEEVLMYEKVDKQLHERNNDSKIKDRVKDRMYRLSDHKSLGEKERVFNRLKREPVLRHRVRNLGPELMERRNHEAIRETSRQFKPQRRTEPGDLYERGRLGKEQVKINPKEVKELHLLLDENVKSNSEEMKQNSLNPEEKVFKESLHRMIETYREHRHYRFAPRNEKEIFENLAKSVKAPPVDSYGIGTTSQSRTVPLKEQIRALDRMMERLTNDLHLDDDGSPESDESIGKDESRMVDDLDTRPTGLDFRNDDRLELGDE